jgi:hypothetical protein
MTHRPSSRVLVVALVGAILAVAQAAHATTPLVARPPAGPWYTVSELRQLKAYSAMSFAEKQKFLADDPQPRSRTSGPRLAGPWYTPKERLALTRYANASIADRKAMLIGTGISTSPRTTVFHWRDATIGAAAALIVALLTVSVVYAISRTKNHRHGLRPT